MPYRLKILIIILLPRYYGHVHWTYACLETFVSKVTCVLSGMAGPLSYWCSRITLYRHPKLEKWSSRWFVENLGLSTCSLRLSWKYPPPPVPFIQSKITVIQDRVLSCQNFMLYILYICSKCEIGWTKHSQMAAQIMLYCRKCTSIDQRPHDDVNESNYYYYFVHQGGRRNFHNTLGISERLVIWLCLSETYGSWLIVWLLLCIVCIL